MKTLTATYQRNNQQALNQGLNEAKNVMTTIMKKLTNVSPFLLLLVPVFVMTIFSFTITAPQQEEAAMNASPKAGTVLIKVADKLLK